MTDRPFTGYCPEHGPVVAVRSTHPDAARIGLCPACMRICTGPGADAALARLAEPTVQEALEAAERESREQTAAWRSGPKRGETAQEQRRLAGLAGSAAIWLRGWLAGRAGA